MKRFWQFMLVFVLSFGLLIGCSADNTADKKKETKTESEAYPVTIKDATGKEVKIEKEPEKIVSLIPSNTEIAFALGLGDKMVGVTDYDTYPKEVKNIEKIGGLDVNVEKVIALKPDLVLAHASAMSTAEDGLNQMRESGITVLVVNEASSFDKVYDSIELIGKATGKQKEAKDLVKSMTTKLKAIEEKTKQVESPKKVYVEVSPSPSIYTAGKNTFIDEFLTTIHAENVAKELEGWPQISEEKVIEWNPDTIITLYHGDMVEKVEYKIENREAWSDITAVKEKQVVEVDSDLTSRPGPRLVEGVEEFANAVYPEIFAK
ncbi:ABC transporter substrate-binding protein [Massilibacterium senegalense]|uniref:ABC transporter substrate-binding protein n=1 Tax=Massilibacterium senegalense TaxID=1632858 RepID=UPI000783CB1E|nr:ABC transporter substrate-binding protein [Massilibacterium senegalense]